MQDITNDRDTPTMTETRRHLLATLQSLRDREHPMEPDRARAIAQVANVVVESARVEVEYIKATNGSAKSSFIEPQAAPVVSPATGGAIERTATGLVHRIGN